MVYGRPSRLFAVTLIACAASMPAIGATFYYDAYGGFIAGTDVAAGTGTFANDPDTAAGGAFDVGADADPRMVAGRFVDVSWGIPQSALGPYEGRSGFALSKVNDGLVVTDGTPVDFGKLTHFNRPIADPSTTWLTAVQLDWTLQLFATSGDALANLNPIQSVDLRFTLYNWETPNDPGSNPAYSVSFDGGATWTTGPSGVCPGSYPAGTLIVGPAGRIFRSAEVDTPSNPAWNGQCADAHVYEGSGANVYRFSHQGRDYLLELSGFYNQLGELTGTFWACENRDCFGTVKLHIHDQTLPPPAQIPTLSQWGAILLATLMGGAGLLCSRRQRARPHRDRAALR
jgi:hypothetical protein